MAQITKAKAEIPDTKPTPDESKAVIGFCTQCEGPMYTSIFHVVVEDKKGNQTGAQLCSMECYNAFREKVEV